MTRGQIYNRVRYEQAKMLDHSGWNGVLKRRITPSDCDMWIDFNGKRQLFVELKTTESLELGTGQRRAYENLLKIGQGKIVVAVARVNTPPDRDIDTFRDVEAFQVWTVSEKWPTIYGADKWQQFVLELEKRAEAL